MITIYTDGASRGNPGPGGWGAVISYKKSQNNELGIKNQEWIKEIGGSDPHTTNNKMELTGAVEALKYLNSLFIIHDSIILYTDSEYVMKGITEWIHNWQKKNWRTAAKKPVMNQDLWQKLLEVSEGKNLSWKYVRGHSGDKLNDRCDEIATMFADGEDPKLYAGPRANYK